jgi:hypothetical protein
MKRLTTALENLDEEISTLEDKIGLDGTAHQTQQKKLAEQLKQSRTHEAAVLAIAQKVAARLDKTIEHVERVLRD